jgi:hypothetical protein
MLLVVLVSSIQAWSYRITDNYTIESKFKINALGAGIAFRAFEGFNGQICLWQFNVGTDGSKSLFRPHDWKVGGILLAEINTADKGVALNTTNWFVTKIVISNNGQHADTYLRRDDQTEFTLIDSRDGNFRYGLVGTRQDHDGNVNESATYDYFKVTANETGDVLYDENFEATNGDWRNDPIWNETEGTLTTEGRNLSEVKYFPNNMFKDAVKMHYALEADVTIESGFVSFVFGLTDGGTNYMWQISPNYYGDGSVNTYYHLDNGNESWKAHPAGPRYSDFDAAAFIDTKRHLKIEVLANVVYTYIDGQLQDTFVQCDMTDLALLNSGKIGIRADGGNGKNHIAYIDNVKLTEYDTDGYATVVLYEPFTDGTAHRFNIDGVSGASIESVGGDYALKIETGSNRVRLIQSDCSGHSYQANGLCQYCGGYQAPGNDGGTYTIGNMGQLMAFAEIVNSSNQSAVGSLTADIDMKNYHRFTPIGLNNDGSWQRPFQGTFYGNNHVISNLYVKTECEGGLFSRLRGGKIYNLGIENAHIESTANLRCGAIAGEHHDNAWMYNCFARGTIKFVTTHAQTNALAGEGHGGHFVNCYTTLGTICCALPYGGTTENCYSGSDVESKRASGELCYLLDSCLCYDATWRQNIGTDAYPELDPTHGIVNYISAVGYTTQYIPTTDVEIPSGVEAYAGVVNGDYLRLVAIGNAISKDDAVILKGSKGYYSFVPTTGASEAETNNLQGSNGNVSGGEDIYALAQLNEKVGFYRVDDGVTVPKGKAYLNEGSSVKGFTFVFDDESTAIKTISDSPLKGENIYNLVGQRISKMQRGINIINGKKVLK